MIEGWKWPPVIGLNNTGRYYSRLPPATNKWAEPQTGCWTSNSKAADKSFLANHPPESSYSPPLFFFNILEVLYKIHSHNANQVGLLLNTVKIVACGPQYYQGLVQTRFHSVGAWHQQGTMLWFSWVWHSTQPSLGLRSQPQELQPMWMFVTQSQRGEPRNSFLIPTQSE